MNPPRLLLSCTVLAIAVGCAPKDADVASAETPNAANVAARARAEDDRADRAPKTIAPQAPLSREQQVETAKKDEKPEYLKRRMLQEIERQHKRAKGR